MSTSDKLIQEYHNAAIAAGFNSDDEVMTAWSNNPLSVTHIIKIRLAALEAKRIELGLI